MDTLAEMKESLEMTLANLDKLNPDFCAYDTMFDLMAGLKKTCNNCTELSSEQRETVEDMIIQSGYMTSEDLVRDLSDIIRSGDGKDRIWHFLGANSFNWNQCAFHEDGYGNIDKFTVNDMRCLVEDILNELGPDIGL